MESKKVTEVLNEGKEKKNKNKKDLSNGVIAGAAAAAGVAGVGVGYAVEETLLSPSEDIVEEVVVETVAEPVAVAQTNPVEPQKPEVIVEPDKVDEVVVPEPTEDVIAEQDSEILAEPEVEPEVIIDESVDAEIETEVDIQNQETIDGEQPVIDVPVLTDEPNPDDVAETILSGQEIDPNDIDADEMILFNDVEMVYTVEGESYAAASFQDVEGNDLVMADIDGDMEFDLVLTPEGDAVAEISGINASDAEMMIEPEPTYMAQNEFDENLPMDGESFENDMMLS